MGGGFCKEYPPMDCLLSLFSEVLALGLEHPLVAGAVMGLSSALMLGGR